MTSETFVLLSGALTFGAPMVLAVRELLALNNSGGAPWRDPDPEKPPPFAPDGTAAPRKPLPDCLIPKPRADRLTSAPVARLPELVD